MCHGSRPSWCWNLDTVEGRLTQAAGIPHDMPKTYSWHYMEWLHHQQGCSRQHGSAKHTQYHSCSSSLHLQPYSSFAWHTSTQDSEASRSRDTPHPDWNRLAGRPRTTWMSQIMRDTGLTAADAWALTDDRSTWRALRPTADYAQQWVSEWGVTRCHYLSILWFLLITN